MASASESPAPVPKRIPESPHLSILQSRPPPRHGTPGAQGPPLQPVSLRNGSSPLSFKCGACPWVCPADVPAGGAGAMTCPGVCGWHTSPSENSLCIQQVPAGCSRRRVHPQKDPLRLDVNTQEAVPLRAVLCPREKTQMVAGGARGRTGTPTSGTPWSRALGGAATQGVSRDVPRAGAHTHLWLGHWALLSGWVLFCGCTDCPPAERPAQTGAGPPLHPSTLAMSITPGGVPLQPSTSGPGSSVSTAS